MPPRAPRPRRGAEPSRSRASVPGRYGDRLRDLARRVRGLKISRRNPDAFFEDKSEIAGELFDMAREMDR